MQAKTKIGDNYLENEYVSRILWQVFFFYNISLLSYLGYELKDQKPDISYFIKTWI